MGTDTASAAQQMTVSNTTAPWRAIYYTLLLGALAGYALFIFRMGFSAGGHRYWTLVDDAMISMRYAANVAGGHGVVWNAGDAPVEGISNFGWMLWMVLPHLMELPPAQISLFVMLTGAVVLLGLIVAVKRAMQALEATDLATAIACWAVAFFFPIVFWTLRGMEVGLLTLIAVAATTTTLRMQPAFTPLRAVTLGTLVLLGVAVRLDFGAQAAPLIAFAAYCAYTQRRGRSFAILSGIVVLGVLTYVSFKLWYFGDVYPNTYYLKLTGVSLLARLKVGVAAFALVGLEDVQFPLIISLGVYLACPRLITQRVLLVASLFAVQLMYSIYSGGDFNELEVRGANRFITQGVPFAIMLAAMCASEVFARLYTQGEGSKRPPGRWPTVGMWAFMTAALIMSMSGNEWFRYGLQNVPEMQREAERVRIGLLIGSGTSETAVVACHAAGQIPYYSRRRSVDLLGKTDPIIAKGPATGPFRPGHNKQNLGHSIGELKPDVVVLGFDTDEAWLRRAGYEQLPSRIWVLSSSARVNKEILSERPR